MCASSKSERNLTENVANTAVPQKPRQFTVSQLQQWLSRLNLQCNRWAVNHRAVGPSHAGNILLRVIWGQVEVGSLADNRRVQQPFYSAAHCKVDQLSSRKPVSCWSSLFLIISWWSITLLPPPNNVLSPCSAPNIPPPSRLIWWLSVKVVSNSYHHKGWEQTEKQPPLTFLRYSSQAYCIGEEKCYCMRLEKNTTSLSRGNSSLNGVCLGEATSVQTEVLSGWRVGGDIAHN